jgi:glycosyltransferase involved in cell wall biosynthesis
VTVSAVIPTFNCSKYIVDAVESALKQTSVDLEVIVVDDGSTDDTAERLACFGDRIRYIRQENGGPSKARNRGIREAKGELIAFLDADDRWLPHKTAKQVELLEQRPKVGLVHTGIFVCSEETGEQWVGPADRTPFTGYCYPRIFWGHAVPPSAAMIRKSVFDQVGVFDEMIRGPSYEDQDLWLRIAREYEFAYIPEPLIIYRVHGANGSLNLQRNVEDEYRVLVKTLREDPSLWTKLDRARARQKLYGLAFSSGYGRVHAGETRRAREFFRAAWSHSPFNPLPLAYWTFSFMPRRVRESITTMKRAIAKKTTNEST